MWLTAAAIFCLLNVCGGCGGEDQGCVQAWQWRLPQRYEVHPDALTPSGIPVDTSGTGVDVEEIDRRVQAVASCLGVTAESPTIKVAPDSIPSCVGAWLLLPIEAPVEGCYAKVQTPSDACPCHWRTGIQPDGSIVIPPDLYNLGDPLTRIMAAVYDPWTNERTTACALKGAGLASYGTH